MNARDLEDGLLPENRDPIVWDAILSANGLWLMKKAYLPAFYACVYFSQCNGNKLLHLITDDALDLFSRNRIAWQDFLALSEPHMRFILSPLRSQILRESLDSSKDPCLLAERLSKLPHFDEREIMMAKYVDVFVVPVPKKNLKVYKNAAKLFGKVCLEHGALTYKEFIADDAKPGKLTSFPQSVKLKAGETVLVSFAKYKSRAHRNQVNKKVMKDPRLAKMMDAKNLPFDGKRMFWGGFKTFLAL